MVVASIAAIVAVHWKASWWTWARGDSRVAAEHGNARSVLGATKRDHVLANVCGDDLTTLWIAMCEDVLNEIVTELIARDVDERHAWTVWTSLADAVEVAIKKVAAADLEALLNNLGCELVHAVLRREANDMVDGASAIGDGSMLADVLDTPVAKLAMGDNIDA